ncbi:hypothetical protein ABL78_6824 [Leptomonas seymouri]|uniref:Leucine-rich repeat protein n=1 Tax=Leptomonas seymouri TaxID=5684 RepID=A0A0N0P3H5_LEPSE|nr:hypothetical protein ABL78_6824 [Leptomonas seymouri]|eukprot:KPI84126.1 hypothetical protein ABL78_6824 [Leptomonas seymouri]
MATPLDASSASSTRRLCRTADCLRVLCDVLLKEELFEEYPPLALAFAHPLTRLYCEMWRAECPGDLECCTTTASSYYTESALGCAEGGAPAVGDAPSPAPFVSVGGCRVANPAALADPPERGGAGITRTSMMTPAAVFAGSPFASSTRHQIGSLLPPLTSATALGATSPQSSAALASRRVWRGTPVVDPSVPLYAPWTYTEMIFKLPIGMKLGHVRIITTPRPRSGADSSGGDAQLVRGFFSHVPAAASLRAAALSRDHSASARKDDAAWVPPAPLIEPESESEALQPRGANEAEAGSSTATHAVRPVVEAEDDWEASALLEEALMESVALSTARTATASAAPAPGQRSRGAASQRVCSAAVGPAKASAVAVGLSSTMGRRPSAAILRNTPHASHQPAAHAVPDAVTAALPPPCEWWLRRPIVPSPSAAVATTCAQEARTLPLYVHCVEATKQWVDWFDGLQRLRGEGEGGAEGSPVQPAVSLRGVSLTGWSPMYVAPPLATAAELSQLGTTLCIEEALPRTLPLRALHLESTVSAMQVLLSAGCASAGAAGHGSLVALDLPYLQDTDTGCQCGGLALRDGAGPRLAQATGPLHSLADALNALPQLRFLSLSYGSASWTSSAGRWEGAGDGRDEEVAQPLEELRLAGVAAVPAYALASTSHRCAALRVLDLSSTGITEVELGALVFGGWYAGAARDAKRESPLVWLEELRLAACSSLLRVDALAALPRLRRLNLQASGVCRLEDLAGCDALEEVVLNQCRRVTQLHPLWHLPRLRCVEAVSVRSLQREGGLLPLPPSDALRAHGDDESAIAAAHDVDFAAPLCRLNLSVAAFVHGTAVARLAVALRDISGRLRSLTVLLLNDTSANDDTVKILAGEPAGARPAHGRGGGAPPVAATELRELSLAGCLGVRDLGPLGLLPHLRSVVADSASVERLDGLQRSRSLVSLSLVHCMQLWSIAPLAHLPTLRTLDVSHTPLNDAGLLRFVFPDLVSEFIARQLHGESSPDAALVAAALPSSSVVPSQVEELRLRLCASLRFVGCVSHLPRLRRLDASETAVFDRGVVNFFAAPAALLHTRLWAAPAGSAATWAEEEGGRAALRHDGCLATASMPDEAALLCAWRRTGALPPPRCTPSLRLSSDASASAAAAAATSTTTTRREAGVAKGNPECWLMFDVAAVETLTHLSFAYCAGVRSVTPCAFFRHLTSLDMTATAIDSAALLAFTNLLHECCCVDSEDDASATLVVEREGLRACVRHGSLLIDKDREPHAARRQVAPRRPYTLTALTLSLCAYVTDVRCCATIPSLTHLTLCNTRVDNASIEALAAHPALPAAPTTASAIAERRWWARHQCALQSLDISYCREVTDVTPLLQAPALDALQPFSRAGLRELRVGHSGVTTVREELRTLNLHSRCVLMF